MSHTNTLNTAKAVSTGADNAPLCPWERAPSGPYSAQDVPLAALTSQFVAKRIAPFIVRTAGCHIWTRGTNGKGYGRIRIGAGMYGVHRVTYALAYGNPPAGTVLDHLCGVTQCVNPEHLEPVTQGENVRRSSLARSSSGRYEGIEGR